MNKLIFALAALALLIPAAISDLRTRRIKLVTLLCLLVLAAGAVVFNCLSAKSLQPLWSLGAGALTGFLLTAVPAVKGSLGGGDVKIAALCGLGLGFPDVLTFLFVSFIAASCFALAYMMTLRACRSPAESAKQLKQLKLPLLPFLAGGMLCLAAVYVNAL